MFFPTSGCKLPSSEAGAKADSLDRVLAEWKEWAEESDDGIWEGDSTHSFSLELEKVYGGETELEPLFYDVTSFDISGDTIFIADNQMETLLALDLDGNLLWEVGGTGEGPGLFSGIAQLDVNDNYIAIANMGNARVDVFSRNGEWLNSIHVMVPFDVTFLNDTSFIMVSLQKTGGIAHVYSVSGEELSSFGSVEAFPTSVLGGGNVDLHCALIGSDLLAINSYFYDQIEIYSIKDERLLQRFGRILPLDIEENHPRSNPSLTTFLLDVFVGPEGMINVPLRPVSPERTTDTREFNIANLSIVDRYDLNGKYLDSYVIPTTGGQMLYNDGDLYVSNWVESALYRYKVVFK